MLRIARWDELYENAGSRKLKRLHGVLLTNSFESERYLELLQEKNAAVLFAAFVMMCQVASTCRPRGTLRRDNGKPHDAHSLAVKTRAPEAWFRQAIPYFLANGNANELGWLVEEEPPENAHSSASGLADSRRSSTSLPADASHATGENTPPCISIGIGITPQTPQGAVAGGAAETSAASANGVVDAPPSPASSLPVTRGHNWCETMIANEERRTLPSRLDNVAFRKAWLDWVRYLCGRRRGAVVPTLETLDRHLDKLEKLGTAYAIRAIDNAINRLLAEPELPHENKHSSSSSHAPANVSTAAGPRAYAHTPDYSSV